MPTTMTYRQVREFVKSQIGACCTPEQLTLLMQNNLVEVTAALGIEEPRGVRSVTMAIDATEYTLASLSPPLEVISAVVVDGCEWKRRPPSCRTCGLECTCDSEPTWYIEDGKLIFSEAFKVATPIKIRGLNEIDLSFYEDSDGLPVGPLPGPEDDPMDRTWKLVALPTALHSVFAKRVLGMALLPTDPAQGATWISIADQEIETWKGRRNSGVVLPGATFSMGGGRRRAASWGAYDKNRYW